MWIRGRSCRGIEWAATGDQPQRRVRCGAEDRTPRERRLGDDLDPGDTEDRGRAVCPEHPYLVSQLYVLQVEEHRSPSVAVDVLVDERRPGLPRGDHMVEPA